MKTKAKWRRLLSAALALVMVVGMLPAASMTAFAATGTGSQSDPIVVTTWDELKTEEQNAQDSGAEYTYIKLGADIVKDDQTDETFYGVQLGGAFKGTIVLDLNGRLLKLKNDKNESVGVITLYGGNLTVTDTSAAKTGQIVSDQPKAANAALAVRGGNLTVDGGTFSNLCAQTYAIIEKSGSLTINGGTFESENSYNTCIYSDGGSLTVNGGTICGDLYIDNTEGDREISFNRCTFENGTVDHRGKFWTMFPENVVIRYGSGTTMKNLQYGSTAVNDINFWTGVTKVEIYSDNFEADVTVTTWDELWTEMQNAPTDRPYCIKLGKNLNYSGTDNSKVLGLSNYNQNVILDLNGYYIAMNSSLSPNCAILLDQGTLTIKDSSAAKTGKVMYTRVASSGKVIWTSGTTGLLIINGGTYETNGGGTILLQGSDTIINDGTFYGGSVRLIEHVMEGAKLTVNGGVFLSQGASPEYTISGHDLALINFDSATLNGGTFYGNIICNSELTKEDLDKCLGDDRIMVTINQGALTYEPYINGNKEIFASMIKIVPVDEQERTGSGTKADPYVVYTFDQLRNAVMLTDPTMYIKLGTNIKYESDTADYRLPAIRGNTVVLDLNGNYLLCRNNDDEGDKRVMMYVAPGTDFTITDSVGTGGIAFYGQSAQTGVSSLSVDAMFYVAGDNSKLTLDHILCGSYYQNIALAELNGRVVLKGGKLATRKAVALNIRNYGAAEFYDGAFVYTGSNPGIPLEVEKIHRYISMTLHSVELTRKLRMRTATRKPL